MEIKKADDIDVVCPYCKKVLEELLVKHIKLNSLNKRPIYACPECKSILPPPGAGL